MSSADFVVPFGIRILEDGTEKTVYLEDIGATEDDVAANYGGGADSYAQNAASRFWP